MSANTIDENSPMPDHNSSRPAFPMALPLEYTDYERGLTKREAIATAALQGLLAREPSPSASYNTREVTAHAAVAYADALLAELAKAPDDASQ